jgi:hypothetical protein
MRNTPAGFEVRVTLAATLAQLPSRDQARPAGNRARSP